MTYQDLALIGMKFGRFSRLRLVAPLDIFHGDFMPK